jgi:hypothetical protein
VSSVLRRLERAARLRHRGPGRDHVTALLMLDATSREELEEVHRLIIATHARYCAECRGRPAQHVQLEAELW